MHLGSHYPSVDVPSESISTMNFPFCSILQNGGRRSSFKQSVHVPFSEQILQVLKVQGIHSKVELFS